ncbi:hypothetical protein [Lacinutrix algicola]|nr:hypothetical protein [Lacinutrix algicola]
MSIKQQPLNVKILRYYPTHTEENHIISISFVERKSNHINSYH